MENKRWSNHEWDSTAFMIAFLLIFGGFIVLCVVFQDFRASDVAKSLMMIFSTVIGAMGTYFFGRKNQQQNGDPKQP